MSDPTPGPDPAVEQWREATIQSTGARLRAALEANEELAAENERLRAEVEGLRHRIAGRTGTHILTEKGLAAIQATDPKRPS